MALTSTKARKEIGQRLCQERERLGYKPIQIAQLIGVPEDVYLKQEDGEVDIGVFNLTKLHACGFDVLFIVTSTRHKPVQEESELLRRFRELSCRGRNSLFTTLDALERLAPNLKNKLDRLRAK